MKKKKEITIFEHTKPPKKEYFIEERKYADGTIRYIPKYKYEGDSKIYPMLLIGIAEHENKEDAIKEIDFDISTTPVEIITYKV
jgi:hypothetical protein